MFRIKDLGIFGDVSYERRLVIYFDVLGWKDRIERAGRNPSRIAELKMISAVFAFDQRGAFGEEGGLLTSFSDNVVISLPYKADTIQMVLEGIGKVQLGAAIWGFFVRGAVTIGDLYHDARSVFGPALVRGYELESRHAKSPRIILDPDVHELANMAGPIVRDGDFDIVDPFTTSFIAEAARDADSKRFRDFFKSLGGRTSERRRTNSVRPDPAFDYSAPHTNRVGPSS